MNINYKNSKVSIIIKIKQQSKILHTQKIMQPLQSQFKHKNSRIKLSHFALGLDEELLFSNLFVYYKCFSELRAHAVTQTTPYQYCKSPFFIKMNINV